MANLKTIHLENVSPKLLQIKNSELAIPGFYQPNKPIVSISGFSPELFVLNTK
jgi:FKBP12-rapamycin complex-associated protein